MKFVFKKTNELNPEEKAQICDLFQNVFKRGMSINKFEHQYAKTILGYSYHGLMIDRDKIVGSYTCVPFKYKFFNQDFIFALSVATMTNKEYRGNPFNLKKMADLVYHALVDDKISFVFGFPNKDVYLVRKKILAWVDIGELDFYALPIKVGAVTARLRGFNWLSVLFADFVNKIPKTINSGELINESECNIEKVSDSEFFGYRYDDTYKIIKDGERRYFVYKIYYENGIKTLYLIDLAPLQKRCFESAVKFIYMKEKGKIDIIIYIGSLKFWPVNMFKVPKKLEPRKVRMAGKILINGMIDERVFDINNWNVNLSNFDVR